jgi:uncharacterized membrane protein YadS
MSTPAPAGNAPSGSAAAPSPRSGLSWLKTDDGWAIVLGLGLVAAAALALAGGTSLRWVAVAPQKWAQPQEALAQLATQAPRYLALLLLWLLAFGAATRALGLRLAAFVPAFLFVFAASTAIVTLGAWSQAERFNLEPPLVALALGLLCANLLRLPAWLDAGFRVELYVKTGIVLLGATLPLTLLLSAGPVAIAQAAVISLATYGIIFWVARRLGIDPRFAATLGAGGAVCGVSAAIAVASAVGARREQGPVTITIVVFWAIVMIFVLPLAARALLLPTGVAGAWIGTSEFADAAGFAAAQTYGGYAGQVPGIAGSADAAVNAFTLMKVIGRDLWIGIWAFVLSIVAAARWGDTGVRREVRASEIWRRFPKFVIGFVLASLAIAVLAAGVGAADTNRVLKPELIAPLKTLRTWAFTFCFLSIGLSTRWRDLAQAGARPFLAFSAGVAVNVALGFLLSAVVFGSYWAAFGAP